MYPSLGKMESPIRKTPNNKGAIALHKGAF